MTTCERCQEDGAERHSLLIALDGAGNEMAVFTLCRACYNYGVMLEPIVGVTAFLTINRVYWTSIYRKREHFITVQETEGSIYAEVIADSQGSFRPGVQIRRSALRQMEYFREEIATSQDGAIVAHEPE